MCFFSTHNINHPIQKADIICQFPKTVALSASTFDDRNVDHFQRLFGKKAKVVTPLIVRKALGMQNKTVWAMYDQIGSHIDWDHVVDKKERTKFLRRLKFLRYDATSDMVHVMDVKSKEEFELYKHNGTYVSGSGADFVFVFL
jgi:hypothetical protein